MKKNNKQWNQGDLEKNPFAMQRKEASYRTEINASRETVFEGACQLDWSKFEAGAILFQNPKLQTYWTTTLLDRESHHYQAVLTNPDLAIGRLDVEMLEKNGDTIVFFKMSYTVLSEAGSVLFDDGLDLRMTKLLGSFGNKLKRRVTTEPAERKEAKPQPVQSQVVEHEIVMNGDIDEIFPLACPVAELKWIDNWKFDLIYTESGINETGCIFIERNSSVAVLRCPNVDTYWYTTLFDTEKHRFNAVWTTGDLCIAHWEFSLEEIGEGQVRANFSLIYNGLTSDGNRIINESDFEQRMKRVLAFLATSMKQYVETRTVFSVPLKRKMQTVASLIGASLGRHIRKRRAGPAPLTSSATTGQDAF